jgi:uncharacterized protein involved in cysteine biosynthesis
MKSQTITMTPDGGHWWRMRLTHIAILLVLIVPVVILVVVCMLNPFWFRDRWINWLESSINEFSRWRNRLLYRIYLGMDPDVWHALKD